VAWLSRTFDWIATHEAILSGIAAAVAIVGVALTILIRASHLLRDRRAGGRAAPEAAATLDPPQQEGPWNATASTQEIHYCTTHDGVRIAWSSVGEGPPLVRALGWFTNLETEWNHPDRRQVWEQLALRHRLIRYDGRGIGLSEREVDHFDADTRLADLEAVIEAAGVDRFALMGISEGGTTAIAYAARHPERVTHLVLWGSFLGLAPFTATDAKRWEALYGLIETGWGGDSPAFRQLFTALFLPDGTAEQNQHFNELQRTSATPQTARHFLTSVSQLDVREEAPQVRAPTLVMHRSGDLVVPLDEGRKLAAAVPGARMVTLPGNNHYMMWQEEDAWHGRHPRPPAAC
jgi:pimeloyl-ACP methyl ester carboxylesterase